MSSLNFLNYHRRKSVHRRVHKIKVFILEVIYGARNGLLVALFIPGGTPHNGLYGQAPRERGTFFRLQVYTRVEISLAEVYETVGKCVISVSKKAQKDVGSRSRCSSFLARKHTLHSKILYLLSPLLLPRNRCKHFRSIDLFYTY